MELLAAVYELSWSQRKRNSDEKIRILFVTTADSKMWKKSREKKIEHKEDEEKYRNALQWKENEFKKCNIQKQSKITVKN